MHGLIHSLINQYIKERHGKDVLDQVVKNAGYSGKIYMQMSQYPDEEAVKIITAATTMLGADTKEVLFDFGKFIAPILADKYKFLIKPEWKTKEFLMNTEDTIHKTVRARHSEAMPPKLKFEEIGENKLRFTYNSERNMPEVAAGIMEGVAELHNEQLTITSHKENGATIMEITISPKQLT